MGLKDVVLRAWEILWPSYSEEEARKTWEEKRLVGDYELPHFPDEEPPEGSSWEEYRTLRRKKAKEKLEEDKKNAPTTEGEPDPDKFPALPKYSKYPGQTFLVSSKIEMTPSVSRTRLERTKPRNQLPDLTKNPSLTVSDIEDIKRAVNEFKEKE